MTLDDIKVGDRLTTEQLDIIEVRIDELITLKAIEGYEAVELSWLIDVLETSLKLAQSKNGLELTLIKGGKS